MERLKQNLFLRMSTSEMVYIIFVERSSTFWLGSFVQ